MHDVHYGPALDAIRGTLANLTRLRQCLLDSHIREQQAGIVAREAKVDRLLLSHSVPAGSIAEGVWREAAARDFGGGIVLGCDLMEL